MLVHTLNSLIRSVYFYLCCTVSILPIRWPPWILLRYMLIRSTTATSLAREELVVCILNTGHMHCCNPVNCAMCSCCSLSLSSPLFSSLCLCLSFPSLHFSFLSSSSPLLSSPCFLSLLYPTLLCFPLPLPFLPLLLCHHSVSVILFSHEFSFFSSSSSFPAPLCTSHPLPFPPLSALLFLFPLFLSLFPHPLPFLPLHTLPCLFWTSLSEPHTIMTFMLTSVFT